MELLTKEFQETKKESHLSELNAIPKFFDELPVAEKNTDLPVVKYDGEEHKDRVSLITRNESLEGDVHPITGIAFERRTIELSGEIIEGVFPEFNSFFDAEISEELYEATDYKQFKSCNEQLYEAIEKNTELKGQFTKEQIEQIKEGITNGTAPDGYVWHHDATPGKIQLVNFEIHANTGHTGGRSVWGGGNENR